LRNKQATFTTTRSEIEFALLVGVDSKSTANGWIIESSLEELADLARSAGVEVVGTLTQKLEIPSSTY